MEFVWPQNLDRGYRLQFRSFPAWHWRKYMREGKLHIIVTAFQVVKLFAYGSCCWLRMILRPS
jgi:hypothetical protein